MQSKSTRPQPVAEALARVQSDSLADIERRVREHAEKTYATVKKQRRAVLLDRAQRAATAPLDERTVRGQTNQACAEASRAKKESVLERMRYEMKVLANDRRLFLDEIVRLVDECAELRQQLHHRSAHAACLVSLPQPLAPLGVVEELERVEMKRRYEQMESLRLMKRPRCDVMDAKLSLLGVPDDFDDDQLSADHDVLLQDDAWSALKPSLPSSFSANNHKDQFAPAG